MSELNPNAPVTEWELDEWSRETRAELTAMLIEAGVAHRWDDTVLIAESAREVDIEEILDEIENLEDEIEEQDDDIDQADTKVLAQLSGVAQKIARNPSDANSVASLERLLETIDATSAPGDMSDSVWRQIKDLSSQVEDALVGGDRADEVLAMDLASRLVAILRPNL
ncbi:MAG: hypothetical protein EBV40_01155 [Actinobacteria bacterium]|nr:hypothetical protein [Actinomycetota bacterium]NCU86645.1 hypothetical protein [Actinomycetota bacterium]